MNNKNRKINNLLKFVENLNVTKNLLASIKTKIMNNL